MVLSGVLGICSTVTANVYVASSCILFQLVFWGLSLPVMIGYMLAQVPYKLRTQANSLANGSYSLFGLFPAPSLYGFVYQATGGENSRSGLLAIQLFGLASILILLPSIVCKRVRETKAINERIELLKNEQPVKQEPSKKLNSNEDLFQSAATAASSSE